MSLVDSGLTLHRPLRPVAPGALLSRRSLRRSIPRSHHHRGVWILRIPRHHTPAARQNTLPHRPHSSGLCPPQPGTGLDKTKATTLARLRCRRTILRHPTVRNGHILAPDLLLNKGFLPFSRCHPTPCSRRPQAAVPRRLRTRLTGRGLDMKDASE